MESSEVAAEATIAEMQHQQEEGESEAEAPASLQTSGAFCSNRGGRAGNNEFSRNVGTNSLAACVASVQSVSGCGPWFSYGMKDGWCDCVRASDGACSVEENGGDGQYSVYLLQAA